MASKSKLVNGNSSSSYEIELIEVSEDLCHKKIENFDENHSYVSSVELIEVGEDWVDENIEYSDRNIGKTSNVELSVVEEDCGEDDVELIEVEEDWVDENIKDSGKNEYGKSGFAVDRLDRITELINSIKETKNDPHFNKRGAIRKRKKFSMPLKQRTVVKKQLKQEMHPVRGSCTHDDCNSLGSERRSAINAEFWQQEFPDRYTYGMQLISRSDVKQRRKNTCIVKNNSYQYFLKNDNGELKRDCKTFYLTTLGFSKTNDSFIRTGVGKNRFKAPLPRIIDRVKNLGPNDHDYDAIIAHVKSFQPNVSHHRREHAPKKKYLPETLTIQSMFADFQHKNPDAKCSYYLYRRIVSNELNISFTKLGHEKCETCEEYFLHKKMYPTCSTCDLCVEYGVHKVKYMEARSLYDEQRVLNTETKAFYSGDLEKVIMLPRLDMFKQVIFASRLSSYNDTFAPLGGTANNPSSSKPVAVLWHEGVSGRCKEDITSAFYKFFMLKRDLEECVMWLDNCGSQNKNWALFTFLVYIINSDLIKTDKIQLNYFEPGHTFMSADSFHYQVELSMKVMNKVYDFNDFERAVSLANSGNVEVLSMKYSDFKNWPDLSSRSKKQAGKHYMHEMVQVTASRGSFDFSYKKSFSSTEEFELNFLQEKYRKGGIPSPTEITKDCGIPLQRKESILRLSGVIPEDKIEFYRDSSVSSTTKPKKAAKTYNTKSVPPRKSTQRQNCKLKKTDSKNSKKKSNKSSDPKSSQVNSSQLNQDTFQTVSNLPKSRQLKSGQPESIHIKSNPSKSSHLKSGQLKSIHPIPPKTYPLKSTQPKSGQPNPAKPNTIQTRSSARQQISYQPPTKRMKLNV